MAMSAGQLRQAVLEELRALGFEWQNDELHLSEEQTKTLRRVSPCYRPPFCE